MPQDANCPKCKNVFPVTQARHPIGIRCPGCETDLTAEFRKRPAPIEPGVSPYELLLKPGKPAGGVAEPPPTPKKPRLEDDDEDDEQDKSTGKGSSIIVLFLSALLCFFATGWTREQPAIFYSPISIRRTPPSIPFQTRTLFGQSRKPAANG